MSERDYYMNHAKRGIALVINIRSYDLNPDKLEERVWSAKDVENLEKSLKYLEFDFELRQNLTKAQIKQELQRQANNHENHKNSDCFLCVVMSHGNEEKIVTHDNKEISFEEIMAPIKSCSSLFEKPKLFFFQACRGENEMKRPDSGDLTFEELPSREDFPTQNNNKRQKTLISAESDLLVYNATLRDHLAFGTEKVEPFLCKACARCLMRHTRIYQLICPYPI